MSRRPEQRSGSAATPAASLNKRQELKAAVTTLAFDLPSPPQPGTSWEKSSTGGRTPLPAASASLKSSKTLGRTGAPRSAGSSYWKPGSTGSNAGAWRHDGDCQTDPAYLEALEVPVEVDVAQQTDAFVPPPVWRPRVAPCQDAATQVLPGELLDFDAEVGPVVEVLVGQVLDAAVLEAAEELRLDSLKQRKQELELARYKEQVELMHLEAVARREAELKTLRQREAAELARLQARLAADAVTERDRAASQASLAEPEQHAVEEAQHHEAAPQPEPEPEPEPEAAEALQQEQEQAEEAASSSAEQQLAEQAMEQPNAAAVEVEQSEAAGAAAAEQDDRATSSATPTARLDHLISDRRFEAAMQDMVLPALEAAAYSQLLAAQRPSTSSGSWDSSRMAGSAAGWAGESSAHAAYSSSRPATAQESLPGVTSQLTAAVIG